MISNKQIKNGNIKLCESNGPSWPIAAIVYCILIDLQYAMFFHKN